LTQKGGDIGFVMAWRSPKHPPHW